MGYHLNAYVLKSVKPVQYKHGIPDNLDQYGADDFVMANVPKFDDDIIFDEVPAVGIYRDHVLFDHLAGVYVCDIPEDIQKRINNTVQFLAHLSKTGITKFMDNVRNPYVYRDSKDPILRYAFEGDYQVLYSVEELLAFDYDQLLARSRERYASNVTNDDDVIGTFQKLVNSAKLLGWDAILFCID